MPDSTDRVSTSGVRIAKDFRNNLIIDRFDPVFVRMRASKLKHMCSENSEDAVTWNVFRSLRQITPDAWMPEFCRLGLQSAAPLPTERMTVSLWDDVQPPASLLADGDERSSEIDVILESPFWVWFIEVKYGSDISTRTTMRPDRDQVLRNIDVGSHYAGVRDFYFSLLITDEKQSPKGVERIKRYKNHEAVREMLKHHREDGLPNLKSVTLFRWSDLKEVLKKAGSSTLRDDERGYAERALAWLQGKRLIS